MMTFALPPTSRVVFRRLSVLCASGGYRGATQNGHKRSYRLRRSQQLRTGPQAGAEPTPASVPLTIDVPCNMPVLSEFSSPQQDVDLALAPISMSKTPGLVAVTFRLQYKCCHGQQVCIAGDTEVLGMWSLRKAVPLQWSIGHMWTVRVQLPQGRLVQYKYLVRNRDGTVDRWQPGSNVAVAFPDELDAEAWAIHVDDSWCKGQHFLTAVPASPTADTACLNDMAKGEADVAEVLSTPERNIVSGLVKHFDRTSLATNPSIEWPKATEKYENQALAVVDAADAPSCGADGPATTQSPSTEAEHKQLQWPRVHFSMPPSVQQQDQQQHLNLPTEANVSFPGYHSSCAGEEQASASSAWTHAQPSSTRPTHEVSPYWSAASDPGRLHDNYLIMHRLLHSEQASRLQGAILSSDLLPENAWLGVRTATAVASTQGAKEMNDLAHSSLGALSGSTWESAPDTSHTCEPTLCNDGTLSRATGDDDKGDVRLHDALGVGSRAEVRSRYSDHDTSLDQDLGLDPDLDLDKLMEMAAQLSSQLQEGAAAGANAAQIDLPAATRDPAVAARLLVELDRRIALASMQLQPSRSHTASAGSLR